MLYDPTSRTIPQGPVFLLSTRITRKAPLFRGGAQAHASFRNNMMVPLMAPLRRVPYRGLLLRACARPPAKHPAILSLSVKIAGCFCLPALRAAFSSIALLPSAVWSPWRTVGVMYEKARKRACGNVRPCPVAALRHAQCSDGKLVLRAADPTDSASAVGAFAFRNGLAVFRRARHGVFHCLFRLAFHAVCFHDPSLSFRYSLSLVMFARLHVPVNAMGQKLVYRACFEVALLPKPS